ncbi:MULTISPECIES: helix-turn-helix transcriptional regulator [Vibrio]|uniref:helix-turn-helix transcriptional regulator n=1 Tax=Vibrio TaxID=662 RepID=UPI0018DB2B60|nr:MULTISPECIES: AlpA family transcriptional regulator [Vibrio]HAS6302772.1 AlpA family transcriptional regulator [Vibrio vulnificus]MBH9742026.1 AlpA family transcriptional regulator [Vibrio navarrensis]MBT0094938.1 AlpA family transcriptional regulator [Vibrio alginolyticus]MCC4218235.1 AlpA family transcriptional regulator [Vibrio parahaemolyticus]MDW1890789.1 AlpA family transcriptional regulator [Vibrio sp. Vb1574]
MNNTPNQPQQFDRIVPMAEVATILNRSLKTIWKWRVKDKILPPACMVNGRAIGYRASTLERILASLEGDK